MITTIAVIAAIDEKKKFSDRSDDSDRMETSLSDRSDNDHWDTKSSISVIVFAAIAGEWFPYDRWFFFLSDRSDRSETGLNLSR